ncbi:sugar phosphate nucleotidyltransferase [Roseiflexus sp.]|uniref:nucleotidyltransferase family protein n=1 Tax=Roseiflexus sp. TaxID=2562120 RepID=UPI00398B1217
MKAVILAGGRGTRLAPYTTIFPKPLMPIGDKPILDIVIRQLSHYGFTDITLAVGYLSELLIAYFGDGERFGVTIRYSREEQPLGTAGPIALVDGLDEPFLVMNGDVLTTLNFQELMEFHRSGTAVTTIATYPRRVKIDLGVIEHDEHGVLTRYVEKPTHHYRVSMGIYIFDPRALTYIPRGQRLDLPDLLMRMVHSGETVRCYPHDGYWLDIGRVDDYQQAVKDFEQNKEMFLPQTAV